MNLISLKNKSHFITNIIHSLLYVDNFDIFYYKSLCRIICNSINRMKSYLMLLFFIVERTYMALFYLFCHFLNTDAYICMYIVADRHKKDVWIYVYMWINVYPDEKIEENQIISLYHLCENLYWSILTLWLFVFYTLKTKHK